MPRFHRSCPSVTRVFSCIALITFLAPGTFLRDPPLVVNNSQLISFTPVAPGSVSGQLIAVGAFDLEGAWQMASSNSQFYGMSGLALRREGGLLAVTDGGWLIGFTPPGTPAIQRDFIVPLPSVTGFELSKAERDAESLAHDPATGRSWVGFEANNAVTRFGPSFTRQEARSKPDAMRGWAANSGAEAMLRLGDGRFIILREGTEGLLGSDRHDGLIFDGDPADGAPSQLFSFKPLAGYKPTDMALLPDGKALILLRRLSPFSGFTAAIMLADPADITAGAIWQGRIVARLKTPLAVDNMEGITAQQNADGSVTVWLISDDNQAALQRNLLLKLRWRPERLEQPLR